MNKAFFLDRDGVINEEVDYLYQPEKVVILPGVADALRKLRAAGFLAIVTTNQSGVARGMYSEADVAAVHRRIDELLAAENARVDAYYLCPHHPEFTGKCDCRKPLPGMLLRAVAEWDIDPAVSAMVGDRLSDLKAGRAAGCAAEYLVLTGYGQNVVQKEDVSSIRVVRDLEAAVDDFLSWSGRGAR